MVPLRAGFVLSAIVGAFSALPITAVKAATGAPIVVKRSLSGITEAADAFKADANARYQGLWVQAAEGCGPEFSDDELTALSEQDFDPQFVFTAIQISGRHYDALSVTAGPAGLSRRRLTFLLIKTTRSTALGKMKIRAKRFLETTDTFIWMASL